jgi:cell division protein ZapA
MGKSMTEQATENSISVDIYDQTYHLRGHDTDYIRRLAEIVDTKMRTVASHGKTVDSLRVAVLAALNIADELSTLERKFDSLAGNAQGQTSLRERAHSLAGLLDSVLDEGRKAG